MPRRAMHPPGRPWPVLLAMHGAGRQFFDAVNRALGQFLDAVELHDAVSFLG